MYSMEGLIRAPSRPEEAENQRSLGFWISKPQVVKATTAVPPGLALALYPVRH